MTIEQEARDCLLVYSEIEHARITKALKAKQDRIEELEQLRMRLISKNMDLSTKIKDLKGALKKCVKALEFASTKIDHMSEVGEVCGVCVKIEGAFDTAKKALGGGK